jgi:hypothetical protein
MRVCVGNFTLELNNMGLEKKKIPGKLSPLKKKSLALGRSQGTQLWQQVCVSFMHTILAGECNVSFFFLIILFSWKLHTGINRSSRSSLGHCSRLQNNVEKRAIGCGSAEVVKLGHTPTDVSPAGRLPSLIQHGIGMRTLMWSQSYWPLVLVSEEVGWSGWVG